MSISFRTEYKIDDHVLFEIKTNGSFVAMFAYTKSTNMFSSPARTVSLFLTPENFKEIIKELVNLMRMTLEHCHANITHDSFKINTLEFSLQSATQLKMEIDLGGNEYKGIFDTITNMFELKPRDSLELTWDEFQTFIFTLLQFICLAKKVLGEHLPILQFFNLADTLYRGL